MNVKEKVGEVCGVRLVDAKVGDLVAFTDGTVAVAILKVDEKVLHSDQELAQLFDAVPAYGQKGLPLEEEMAALRGGAGRIFSEPDGVIKTPKEA